MKNINYLAGLIVSFSILINSSNLNGQCSGGSNGGSLSTPTTSFQTQAFTTNNYYTFEAQINRDYVFSLCAADGGSATFSDSQITILYDSDGSYAGGYNDDDCSYLSNVTWTAPATGTYRVLINEYDCSTTTNESGTLAYKWDAVYYTAASGNWGTSGNWSSGLVPSSTTNVVIPNGSTVTIPEDYAAECNNLSIENGGTLTIEIDDDYWGEFNIYGDVTIDGFMNHTGPTMVYLMGSDNYISAGESSTVYELGFLFDTGSGYTMNDDVVIEYLRQISASSSITLGTGVTLTTCFFVQEGTFVMNDGTLQIGCGRTYSVSPDGLNPYFTEANLSIGTGTIEYNAGDVYSATDQTVNSIEYNDLIVWTNNGYTATLGDGTSIYAEDFTIKNPGTAGGEATLNNSVKITGDFNLGASGNGLTLNLAKPIIGSGGTFSMGNNSSHVINNTYSTITSTTITGFEGNTFYGTYKLNSSSSQILGGAYYNLTLDGTGTKTSILDVDANNDLTLTNGTFESGDGSNESVSFLSHTTNWEDVPTVSGGVTTGNNVPSVATLDANATQMEVYVPSDYSGFNLSGCYVYITHEYNADLDIYLEDPDGNVHVLATDRGSDDTGYLGVTFVDGASSLPTTTTGSGLTGNYAAEATTFSSYSGTINGTWTLHVVDDYTSDDGTLDVFRMVLTTPSNYNDINLAGDWIMGAGTFNYGQSDVILDGSSAQYINAGLKDLDFYDLTISGTDVHLYTEDEFGMNVDNDLTINSGKKLTHYCADDHANDYAFGISGNFINSGTFDDTDSDFYLSMDGTSKSIGGTGTFTDTWLQVEGTISVVSSISIAQLLVDPSETCTVNDGLTFTTEYDVINDGTYTLTGSAINYIGDDFENNGTFNENSGSVVFSSSSFSTVHSITSGTGEFYDLSFDTDGSVTLIDDATVNNSVTFTDGIVNPTSTEVLNLSSSASVSGASDASHCSGSVAKTSTSTSKFTFPVGSGTSYRAIAVTPSSTSSTVFTASYTASNPHDQTSLDENNGEIEQVSGVEHWDLDRSGSATAIVELSWNANSNVSDLSDMIVAHWDAALGGGSGAWESAGSSITSGTTGTGTVSSEANWNEYSPFTLGSKTEDNVLPVQLVKFDAVCNEKQIDINWTTASEINNDRFEVEKSINGLDFNAIDIVNGNGTTSGMNYYYSIDDIIEAKAYYRLKQVDYDGNYHLSDMVFATCTLESDFGLQFNGSSENQSNFNVLASGEYQLSIIDMRGRLVYTLNSSIEGSETITINQSNWDQGVYQVILTSGNQMKSVKLVKR